MAVCVESDLAYSHLQQDFFPDKHHPENLEVSGKCGCLIFMLQFLPFLMMFPGCFSCTFCTDICKKALDKDSFLYVSYLMNLSIWG